MHGVFHLRSDDESAVRGMRTSWIGLAYVLLVVLFMSVAAALAWPMPEIGFRSDSSPVSWLSSAQLWAMALIVVRLLAERVLSLGLGTVLLVATIGMAFDEQFMFHELWKYSCGEWLDLCRYSWVRDGPMVLVGCGGLAAAMWLHRTTYSGLARVQLWSGIALGVLALTIDLLDPLPLLSAYEEGFEVLAEGFFLAFLLGLKAQAPSAQS